MVVMMAPVVVVMAPVVVVMMTPVVVVAPVGARRHRRRQNTKRKGKR